MKEELILPYKLEDHLKEICNSNETYANLLSVWNINKKMCQDVLANVVINYPHYTRHDVSHSEAIITNMEMLLGEENIKSLSPTDTWLLLHAAYLHDIGMVIECSRIEENWESKDFQDYLKEAENSFDEALAENARFINSFTEKCDKEEPVTAWPVRVRYAVTLLIADYYRRKHAKDSCVYMQNMGRAFNIDFGFNGLIQQRLINLLADISYLHTESSDKILELDYRTNGFNADYAHPRFLALMLRMGDLLDADNNRFNASNELVFGKIPEVSKNHWEKHMSARHILVTPDIIEYKADCNKPEVYRETRIFLTWLKEEVEFWALNWKDIMPENIKGSAPKLGKCELLLNGVPDIQGLSDLRFTISPEKAFEVIEGANIYDDKFVFIREIIQNALDACKIQMWRDISENKYRSWLKTAHSENLQPYEIERSIFKNYEVDVRMRDYDEDNFEIIIADNGTGLSAEQLKEVCNVGVSYSGDKKRKEEVENMPLWLRPTAGFGIGMQSVFLITDEFEIDSKAPGAEGIHAKITSRRRNGYVQITKSDKLKAQGTQIHVVLPKSINFTYDFRGNTAEYISSKFDPFSSEKNIVYYKIWDIIKDTIEATIFPINIYFEDEKIDTIDEQNFKMMKEASEDGRYQYNLLQNHEMEIWDSETSTMLDIRLENDYDIYIPKFYFKGMEIKNGSYYRNKGVWYKIDFYGLDTNKTLSLDRKQIRKEQIVNVNEILQNAIGFFLNKIEETLFHNDMTLFDDNLKYIYTYWCVRPLKEKIELIKKYKDVFEKLKVDVDILKRNDKNRYDPMKMDFKDIVSNLEQTAIISNLSEFEEHHNMKEYIDIERITKMLNQKADEESFSIIIVNKQFSNILCDENENEIMIVEESNHKLYLKSYTNEQHKPVKLKNESTFRCLIGSLFKKMESKPYPFSDGEVRRAIAGIKGYEAICTKNIPFGIKIDYCSTNGNIICPFTITQWEKNKHLSKEEFVEMVCGSGEFQALVEHVAQFPFEEEISKDKIQGEYIRFMEEVYDIGKREAI